MGTKESKDTSFKCPICEAVIEKKELTDDMQLYEIFSCPHCRNEFEVISLDPFEVGELEPATDMDEEEEY